MNRCNEGDCRPGMYELACRTSSAPLTSHSSSRPGPLKHSSQQAASPLTAGISQALMPVLVGFLLQ